MIPEKAMIEMGATWQPESQIRLIVSQGPNLWRAFAVGGITKYFPSFSMVRPNWPETSVEPPRFFLENAEMGCLVIDARQYPSQLNVNHLFDSPTLFTSTSEEHIRALVALLRARLGRVIAGKVEWEIW